MNWNDYVKWCKENPVECQKPNDPLKEYCNNHPEIKDCYTVHEHDFSKEYPILTAQELPKTGTDFTIVSMLIAGGILWLGHFVQKKLRVNYSKKK